MVRNSLATYVKTCLINYVQFIRNLCHTPQPNRVAERKHRYILEVTKAIRLQTHIPIKFQCHCVQEAGYMINRLASAVLNNKFPYEVFFNQKPTINHLRVLGCLCFAKVPTQSDKMLSRSKIVVHMGYSEIQKSYILYDLSSNFFVNRDVLFREDVFPFYNHKFIVNRIFICDSTGSEDWLDLSFFTILSRSYQTQHFSRSYKCSTTSTDMYFSTTATYSVTTYNAITTYTTITTTCATTSY